MSERKQHITIRLDIHDIPMNIDADYEETYRRAAVWLNKHFKDYQVKYKNASPEKIWAYVALAAAVGLHADVRDKALEPIQQKLSELNNRINEALAPTIINETT